MFLVQSDTTKSPMLHGIRTGLAAHLRSLSVGDSFFVRDGATDKNRLSSAIAALKRSPDGQGKRFTALKVDGGYRVHRFA